jgi:ABC-type lipoprotein export system ATPase subunit
MNYPRGSSWRKWDLHIHAPDTKKNNQYRAEKAHNNILEFYCDKLERSEVAVFGITDYFSADSYFAFMEKFTAKYPKSQKVFFPNIELCTNDVVNSASEEVNLHVIFNSFAPDCDAKVRRFLQHLDTNKTGVGNKKVKACELKTAKDFEEATTNREFIQKAFIEVYGPSADLSEHLLIVTAANNDGIRASRGKQRKALISDELDKFSHAFFGNSGNTSYFLRPDRLEGKVPTDPKPVISGSDAHSFNDLEHCVGKLVIKDGVVIKEPTWIKADPTFEGLKQIIFEPASRVFIGEEPAIESRVRDNKRRYISSVRIAQAPGYDGRHGTWFDREQIDLGKELVAIIGNKGHGKSALTDTIGLLGNSHNQIYELDSKKEEELFSFLNRDKFLKANCASSFVGELHWYAGRPDKNSLDARTDMNVPERVEYLPQKYLEKICANIEDDEFRHKLNEVIFEYVQESDRYGQGSLDDLIAYLTTQAEADISVAKEALHEANTHELALEKRLTADYKKDVEDRLRLKKADIAAHQETKPAVVPPPKKGEQNAAKTANEIATVDTKIATLQRQIKDSRVEQASLSRTAEDLHQARQTIERQVNAVMALKAKYDPLLNKEGLQFDDLVSVTASFIKLDVIITQKRTRLLEIEELLRSETEIDVLGLTEKQAHAAKGKSLMCQEAVLSRSRKELTAKLDKPNRDYQNYLAAIAQWKVRQGVLEGDSKNPASDTLCWLQQEFDAIQKSLPIELKTAKTQRLNASKAVFAEKKRLIKFYDDVKKSIDQEIGKYGNDLRSYNISIEAHLRFSPQFYEDFFRFINQAVKGSFYGADDGKAALKELVRSVPDWESDADTFTFLDKIDRHLHSDQRFGQDEDTDRDIFKQMKQRKEPIDFCDYLFGFDYLETKYDLKIDGKDLKELSPGERGGLLLIFYLMLDKRDIPLVIDQPEDNLDNKSVYEMLVTFLKEAKKRRQIIIVTHNPNLAVVADAEQIIHVSIDKKKNKNDFSYKSGSIEDPEINRAVVDILEGTLPAFHNRRLKYRKQ